MLLSPCPGTFIFLRHYINNWDVFHMENSAATTHFNGHPCEVHCTFQLLIKFLLSVSLPPLPFPCIILSHIWLTTSSTTAFLSFFSSSESKYTLWLYAFVALISEWRLHLPCTIRSTNTPDSMVCSYHLALVLYCSFDNEINKRRVGEGCIYDVSRWG